MKKLKEKKNLNQHLCCMLEVSRKKMLYVNLKECTFFMEKVVFLGYIVSKKNIKMDEENVKIIQERSMSK
jgi:hypothetical protein